MAGYIILCMEAWGIMIIEIIDPEPVAPPPRKYVLTLDENEAIALRSLMLSVHNHTYDPGPISRLVFDLYHAFNGQGFDSDSDIFEDGANPKVRKGK